MCLFVAPPPQASRGRTGSRWCSFWEAWHTLRSPPYASCPRWRTGEQSTWSPPPSSSTAPASSSPWWSGWKCRHNGHTPPKRGGFVLWVSGLFSLLFYKITCSLLKGWSLPSSKQSSCLYQSKHCWHSVEFHDPFDYYQSPALLHTLELNMAVTRVSVSMFPVVPCPSPSAFL